MALDSSLVSLLPILKCAVICLGSNTIELVLFPALFGLFPEALWSTLFVLSSVSTILKIMEIGSQKQVTCTLYVISIPFFFYFSWLEAWLTLYSLYYSSERKQTWGSGRICGSECG